MSTSTTTPRRRGRPPRRGVRHHIRLTLVLWEGEDDDLLAFFAGIPPGGRAAAVKQALRGFETLQAPSAPGEDEDDDLDLEEFLL